MKEATNPPVLAEPKPYYPGPTCRSLTEARATASAVVAGAFRRAEGVTVLAATPATGKTEHALREACRAGRHVQIFVPVTDLGQEIFGRYQALPMRNAERAPAMPFLGRGQPGMCPAGLGDLDGAIATDDQACGSLEGKYACRYLVDGTCPYQRQKAAYAALIAGEASVTIAAHAYMGLPGVLARPDFAVVDERYDPIDVHEMGLEKVTGAVGGSLVDPAVLGQALRANEKAALLDVVGQDGAGRLLGDLQARLAALTAPIFPGCSASTVASVKSSLAASPLPKAIRFARALLDDLASPTDGLQLIRFADLPGRPSTLLVAERQMPITLEGVPTLVMDGTVNERISRLVWGNDLRFRRVSVDHDAAGKIVIRSGSRNSLIGARAEAERAVVSKLVRQEAGDRPMVVCASKPVISDLDLPADAVRIHFGGPDRGLDRFGGVPFIAAVGRDMPSMAVAELRASALLFGTNGRIARATEPVSEIRYQRTRKQGLVPIKVRVHPDPLVQAVIEQAREASVVQALHRGRPVLNPGIEMRYIGSLCLDLIVDEVVGAHVPGRADRFVSRLAEMLVIPVSEKFRPLIGIGHNRKLDEALLLQAHPGGRWIEFREAGQPGQARAGRPQQAWCAAELDDVGAAEALRRLGIAVARVDAVAGKMATASPERPAAIAAEPAPVGGHVDASIPPFRSWEEPPGPGLKSVFDLSDVFAGWDDEPAIDPGDEDLVSDSNAATPPAEVVVDDVADSFFVSAGKLESMDEDDPVLGNEQLLGRLIELGMIARIGGTYWRRRPIAGDVQRPVDREADRPKTPQGDGMTKAENAYDVERDFEFIGPWEWLWRNTEEVDRLRRAGDLVEVDGLHYRRRRQRQVEWA